MPKGKLVNVQVSSLRHAEFTQFITRFLDDVEIKRSTLKMRTSLKLSSRR